MRARHIDRSHLLFITVIHATRVDIPVEGGGEGGGRDRDQRGTTCVTRVRSAARTHTRVCVGGRPVSSSVLGYRCPYVIVSRERRASPPFLPPIRGHAHDTRPRTPGGAFNARSLSSVRERTRRTPGVKTRGRPRGGFVFLHRPLSPLPLSSLAHLGLEHTSLACERKNTFLQHLDPPANLLLGGETNSEYREVLR